MLYKAKKENNIPKKIRTRSGLATSATKATTIPKLAIVIEPASREKNNFETAEMIKSENVLERIQIANIRNSKEKM
jgi:hypothetical protein